jgi:hypothetical protein
VLIFCMSWSVTLASFAVVLVACSERPATAIDAVIVEDTSTSDAPPPRPFDWVQLISTGQSLSVGSSGLPEDPSPQPFENMMLVDSSLSPGYDNMGDVLSLIPLRSPIRLRDPNVAANRIGAYPNNIYGETASEGLSNQLSAISRSRDGMDYITIATVVGQGGRKLDYLSKQLGQDYPEKPTSGDGDRLAYWASLYETTHLQKIANAAGKRFGVGAVFLTHGESDADIPSTPTSPADYEAGIVKLARDYNADLAAITGQTSRIPMFTSQQNTFPLETEVVPTTTHTLWAASVKFPEDILCVGPKYQYEYSEDKVHLVAAAYERLGEKYAQAYDFTVLLGRRWRPLEPTQVTRSGREISIELHVPYPPLSFDTAFASAHQSANHPWRFGKGFEVAAANSNKLEIESVSIIANSIKIVLATDPPTGAIVLRHALVQDQSGALGGQPEGRHGLLRDSDPFVPRDAKTIAVEVFNGASTMIASSPEAFARITLHDRIVIPGMAEELIVIGRAGQTKLLLSGPIGIPSGIVLAKFSSDQRNYLVHFEWLLP